jgi:hypothetical protein
VSVSDEALRRPVAFKLAGKEHAIGEVLADWQDHGFARIAPAHVDWRFRHHRQYYRVRAKEGDIWEIYVDWLAGRRQRKNRPEKARWFAYRRIFGLAEEAEAGAGPSS